MLSEGNEHKATYRDHTLPAPACLFPGDLARLFGRLGEPKTHLALFAAHAVALRIVRRDALSDQALPKRRKIGEGLEGDNVAVEHTNDGRVWRRLHYHKKHYGGQHGEVFVYRDEHEAEVVIKKTTKKQFQDEHGVLELLNAGAMCDQTPGVAIATFPQESWRYPPVYVAMRSMNGTLAQLFEKLWREWKYTPASPSANDLKAVEQLTACVLRQTLGQLRCLWDKGLYYAPDELLAANVLYEVQLEPPRLLIRLGDYGSVHPITPETAIGNVALCLRRLFEQFPYQGEATRVKLKELEEAGPDLVDEALESIESPSEQGRR